MSCAMNTVMGLKPLVAPTRASKRVSQKAAAPVRVAAARKSVVVCKASASKAAAAVTAASAAFTASPAFALVDQRMNGDGVGLPLGINDGALGWVVLGVFTFIWTLYYTSSLTEFGEEGPGDDSGLGL